MMDCFDAWFASAMPPNDWPGRTVTKRVSGVVVLTAGRLAVAPAPPFTKTGAGPLQNSVQAVSVLHATASVIPSTSRQFFAICHPRHCGCQLRAKLFAAQPNAQWKGMPPAHRAEPLRYHAGKHRIAFRRGAIMDGPYCSQSPALIGVTPSTRLIGVSPSPGSPAGSPFDWRLKQSVPITSTKHL